MKTTILKALYLGIFLCLCFFSIKAQNVKVVENENRNVIVVGAKKTLTVSGKVTYLIVKETAKASWKTTAFTAKEIAAPVAKAIFVKALPKITLYLIKQSGTTLKKATPIATKAAITYLKL